VRRRIAEIAQHAIAREVGHEAAVALHDIEGETLVLVAHPVEHFRFDLLGKAGEVGQIAEEDRQIPPLCRSTDIRNLSVRSHRCSLPNARKP
jgi:hypothetical protein